MRLLNSVPAIMIGMAFTTSVIGAPKHDAELVQSAIAAEVRTNNQEAIRARLARSRARLTEHANSKPTEQIGGVIVFATGLNSRQVAEFAVSNQLEVMRAEAKVFVEASGVTETMSFGAHTLFLLDGPLDERLEKMVGHQRGVFMADALSPDASDPAGLREAAYSRDILFYKIEVVGPAASFDRIQKGTEAAAVFVDETTARVEQLAVQRSDTARMKAAGVPPIKGRPYADGPPPGVSVQQGQPSSLSPFPVAPPDAPDKQPKSSQP